MASETYKTLDAMIAAYTEQERRDWLERRYLLSLGDLLPREEAAERVSDLYTWDPSSFKTTTGTWCPTHPTQGGLETPVIQWEFTIMCGTRRSYPTSES
jgi:hypothetical protein